MKTFIYTAEKANGETYEHSVKASDRFEVYALVRKEGSKIISIEESSSRSPLTFLRTLNNLFARVKDSEKIVLARNLATMIKAGLPMSRALSVMERQTRNEALKTVLQDINHSVTQGISFHEALQRHPKVFPPLFISMARAGEESGKLAEALLVVAGQIERAYALKKKIKGALIYPSIIVVAMIAIGILMLIFVVPTLTQTFAEFDLELPKSTQIVIGVSDFFASHTLVALGGLVGVVVLFVAGLRTNRGGRWFETFILHIPLIAPIVKEVNAARTARTLSSLLSAGVEVVEALDITRDVLQNSYYKAVLVEAAQNTKAGRPLAEAFTSHEDLYPVLVGEMIAVGGETGQLTQMLEDVAVFYEAEVEQKTKDLSTVIEPFLMLFIGAVVGFFAVSMVGPIYSISGGI